MSELSQMIASAQSAPAFFDKDSKKGSSIMGRIVSIEARQSIDPVTRKPETWDNSGDAKKQIVIILDSTNIPNAESDDKRTVYVKWSGENRKAFAAACDDAKVAEPKVGDYFTASYEGEGAQPANKMMSPTKLFSYVIESVI